MIVQTDGRTDMTDHVGPPEKFSGDQYQVPATRALQLAMENIFYYLETQYHMQYNIFIFIQ